MKHRSDATDEIICRAHVRVLRPSDTALFLYIVYSVAVFLILIATTECAVTRDPYVMSVHTLGFSILNVTFGAEGITEVLLLKEALFGVAVGLMLLVATPPAIFLLFKRFYKNEMEMTSHFVYVYKRDFRNGVQKVHQLPIDQLDSVDVRNEWFTNGCQIILRSNKGKPVRIHCVTNETDFVRTVMHFYHKYHDHRNVLSDRRQDRGEDREYSRSSGRSGNSEHSRDREYGHDREHSHGYDRETSRDREYSRDREHSHGHEHERSRDRDRGHTYHHSHHSEHGRDRRHDRDRQQSPESTATEK